MTAVIIPSAFDEPLSGVLSVLRLHPTSEGQFEGTNLPQLTNRVYGGQVFAQAVIAAAHTLPKEAEGRQIHAITAGFIRPGSVDEPIYFHVDEMLDGRSFSTRVVTASQNGNKLFTARASFQEIQDGFENEEEQPEAPDPESLTSSVDLFAQLHKPIARFMNSTNVVDMRNVEPAIWVRPAPKTGGRSLVWFKFRSEVPPANELLHRSLLAFATDQFMLEPIMRRHGLYWLDPNLSVATLDHSIWWHRNVDVSDWILAQLESPSSQGGRGLSLARFFQNGHHIATMAQEGMVRQRQPRVEKPDGISTV